MSNETLFYVCGVILAVSAVLTSIAGLKLKGFPGRAFPIVVLWFAILVGASTTFAVMHAKDEDAAKAVELGAAGAEIEKAQSSGPYEAEGALGAESEAEEPTESQERGSVEKEPVGPSEGEAGGKGAGAKGGAGGKGPGGTLQLAADPTELAFDKTSLTSKPGKVTIEFDNPSAIAHDVVIEKEGKEIAASELIAEGKTSVTAELAPGSYVFLCNVPGHAEAGMEGTLTVK